MKGMTVTLLWVVALGLLFVGSRAEGETTAPSVPHVPPADSPGGDSKGPAAGQGGASQTKPRADAKVGQGGIGGNLECFRCRSCEPDQKTWKKDKSCVMCTKTTVKGATEDRSCLYSGNPVNGCEKVHIDGVTSEYCTCTEGLCNVSSVPSLADFLALLSAIAIFWNPF